MSEKIDPELIASAIGALLGIKLSLSDEDGYKCEEPITILRKLAEYTGDCQTDIDRFRKSARFALMQLAEFLSLHAEDPRTGIILLITQKLFFPAAQFPSK